MTDERFADHPFVSSPYLMREDCVTVVIDEQGFQTICNLPRRMHRLRPEVREIEWPVMRSDDP